MQYTKGERYHRKEKIGMAGQSRQQATLLNKVSHVHWHFINVDVVKLLDIFEISGVVRRHQVDGNTLATKATTATNTAGCE